MDYSDQSVGLCYCCMFFTFKHYIYFMMSTNTIQGVVLLVIGIFGLIGQFELLMFQRTISFIFLSLGVLVVFGLLLQLGFLIRHKVLFIGKLMVLINVLTSLLDLLSGLFLLLSLFVELSFIQFNESQKQFSTTKKTVTLIIAIGIIIISLYGFWMTYLQYQTITPLQELLSKQAQVVPTISLRQAVARRFTKNFIGELTPQNGKTGRTARADSTSENSQPYQRQKFSSEDMQEPHSHQRSEKLILNNEKQQAPETITPDNEFYAPSTNTIRIPQDDIQHLRKVRTPRSTLLQQKKN